MATTPSPAAVPEDESQGGLADPPCDAPGSGSEDPVEAELEYQLPGIDNRERALPIRQGDLNRLLLAESDLTKSDRSLLVAFGRILGATFHSEFYEKLHELKELYAPLDPDSDYVSLETHTRAAHPLSDEEFLAPFERTLIRANYSELDIEHIREAIAAPNEMGLTYVPDFSLFEHLKVYVRGYTRITRHCRSVQTKFLKRTVSLDAYQRLVVALKFKPGLNLGPYVKSEVLYLRMFKDVPHVDMEMHLPEQGTKVRMRWIDKAQIASPLMMGIPTLVIKALALITLTPLALGGLLIAPISAGVNSFFGFHRAKQRHLSSMIQRLYYLTLANNASVLTRLVDSAEDEEYKEAMLGYYFLWRSAARGISLTVPELDDLIEQYLRQKTGVEINFEVADALGKLFRLGLASRDQNGRVLILPIDEAYRVLNEQWKATFHDPDCLREALDETRGDTLSG